MGLRLLAVLFAASSMFSIAVRSTPEALRRAASERALLARSVLAVAVVVPLLGALVLRLFPVADPVRAGLLLSLASSSGAVALQFTRKAGAGEYAVALELLLAQVSLVATPLVAQWILHPTGPWHFPFDRVIALGVIGIILPLFAGIVVAQRWPRRSEALGRITGALAGATFIVAFLVIAAPLKAEARSAVGMRAVAAMVSIVLVAMVVGWMLGGPRRETRQVLLTKASVRGAALPLLVAHAVGAEATVAEAIVAYTAVAVPLNFVVTSLLQLRRRRTATA
jgi:predicted Na+-dependent transporter